MSEPNIPLFSPSHRLYEPEAIIPLLRLITGNVTRTCNKINLRTDYKDEKYALTSITKKIYLVRIFD